MKLFLLAGMMASAYLQAGVNPVHWTLAVNKGKAIGPGKTFAAELKAAIDPGWHLYGLNQDDGGPIELEVSTAREDPLLSLGEVTGSKPVQLMDANFGKKVNLYVKSAAFRLMLTLSPEAKQGPLEDRVRVRYQCCNDSMCLPPKTDELALQMTVK